MFEQIGLFFISLIANAFSAFSGGGAGLIQLPVLIFLGLPFATALATHKIAAVALGFGATIRHLKESSLERRFALFILACGLPGVFLGANIILSIPSRYAEISLGVLTLSLGVYSIFKPSLGQQHQLKNQVGVRRWLGGLGLFGIGVLNGSLTSGTGLFVTLWLIQWFGLDYKRAVAYTLILVGVFWNGAGAITLSFLAEAQYTWLPALILGSIFGGYAGAHWSIKKGNQWIKRGFEIVTILIGLKLMLG
ncbi:MAG: sulfite exporter TauE/SafE family protein [Methylococcales bacterium]|nr:sulfite exporter TauE/SafE family protein [Methylococcales bacterium]